MGRITKASTRLVPSTSAPREHGEATNGDVLDLGTGNHYVRFPDGVVVTARHQYTVTDVPGDYTVLNTDGEAVMTFTVAAKADRYETDPDQPVP